MRDQAAAERAAALTINDPAAQKIVDGWPPLTADQRDRLALLLRPGGTDATGT